MLREPFTCCRVKEYYKVTQARKEAKERDGEEFGKDPFDFLPPHYSIDQFRFD